MRTVSRGMISNALRFSFSIPNILQLPISSVRTRSFGIRATKPKMGKNREEVENDNVIKSHPRVNKLQQLMHIESSGGWEKCWEEGLTPWDIGQPAPIIVHLHQSGALPKGRALVPGCGTGYDVVAMASPERYVVGLEISDIAIKKAEEVTTVCKFQVSTYRDVEMQLSSSLPNAKFVSFLKADFFTWCPTELFDLIFDYTFFCAIEPEMRAAWAQKIKDFLKPDGELITLMFPISDHVGGPPYKVSVSE
ncbi:hypothetical protein WN944_015673 [Citrus x changshan-huyou]|uniref:Thiol methyltransferase 2 n=1 Tax=Citrus x changshan-huyou TaxID=2935761 RepID=A0AAP0MEE8_9ROSI